MCNCGRRNIDNTIMSDCDKMYNDEYTIIKKNFLASKKQVLTTYKTMLKSQNKEICEKYLKDEKLKYHNNTKQLIKNLNKKLKECKKLNN